MPFLIPEGWPTIAQRLNVGCAGLDVHKSRQGRLNPYEIGQSSFQDLSCCGRWSPTFKRWAILACPYGTKAWTGLSGFLGDQTLVALDRNVHAGAGQNSSRAISNQGRAEVQGGRRQGRHSYQPRATPWVHQPKTPSALKARFILRPTSSNLELPFPGCPVLVTIWDETTGP